MKVLSRKTLEKQDFGRLPPEKPNPFWEKDAKLDLITWIYKKSKIFGLFFFSIPTILAVILTILFPWPVIPQFTAMTYFSIICLFLFIVSASFLTYYWVKNTFYDYLLRFVKLQDDFIIEIDPKKRELYFNEYKNRIKSPSIIIILISVLVSIGIGYIHFLYYEPILSPTANLFWTIEWIIVWFFIALILLHGLKNIFIGLGLTKDFADEGFLKLELNPLHNDRFGGLSVIGEIAVETSLIITITVLLFPWFFEQLRILEAFLANLGIIVVVLVLAIITIMFVVTFFIPTLRIYNTAKREKERILRDAGSNYKDSYIEYEDMKQHNPDQMKVMHLGLRVGVLMNHFRETEKMKVFPFSMSILTKFLTGFLIPIVFILLQELVL